MSVDKSALEPKEQRRFWLCGSINHLWFTRATECQMASSPQQHFKKSFLSHDMLSGRPLSALCGTDICVQLIIWRGWEMRMTCSFYHFSKRAEIIWQNKQF